LETAHVENNLQENKKKKKNVSHPDTQPLCGKSRRGNDKRKPGPAALYPCGPEQGRPRGVERTTWLIWGLSVAVAAPARRSAI
jgi:hypothetical protein